MLSTACSCYFHRYLVLEYVSGGELLDYLVKCVRLPERGRIECI